MRFALLILVLVGPSLLSATYWSRSSHEAYRVAGGKFVYVQIDLSHVQDQKRVVPEGFRWRHSGLYPAGQPDKPVWKANLDLWVLDELFVTDDGHTAIVFNGATLSFYRDGQLFRERSLHRPKFDHRNDTMPPGTSRRWWQCRNVDTFLVVSNRTGEEFWFLQSTGELCRRKYRSYSPASQLEMAAFEATLAGGESEEMPPDEGSIPDEAEGGWIQRIPAGAEVFISGDGTVRVIVIPEAQPGGPRTVVYDGAGSELLSIPEVFPRPVFLADVEPGSLLGQCHSTESRRCSLVLSVDGEVCASLAYTHGTRTTSIRVFKQGRATALDLPITFEGDLKFSGVELAAVDGEHITVELGYGTDWWERYEIDLNAATTTHSVNFPSDSTRGESNVSRSFGWFGVLAPIAAIAFVILFLGFLAGRLTRRP